MPDKIPEFHPADYLQYLVPFVTGAIGYFIGEQKGRASDGVKQLSTLINEIRDKACQYWDVSASSYVSAEDHRNHSQKLIRKTQELIHSIDELDQTSYWFDQKLYNLYARAYTLKKLITGGAFYTETRDSDATRSQQ